MMISKLRSQDSGGSESSNACCLSIGTKSSSGWMVKGSSSTSESGCRAWKRANATRYPNLWISAKLLGPCSAPFRRPRAVGVPRLALAWFSRVPVLARKHAPRPWRPPPDPLQTLGRQVPTEGGRSGNP
ncbi:hypothetical protein B296_00051035 [Ensete ventricosum]|uniref:Uncharacterized protein n=1 Tax=Ensete ventricosum TaxID=4639 RepID=A0A426WY76_ENSVE|nr:hypothetical protein B296_00051035 [Ensete ventricosum]